MLTPLIYPASIENNVAPQRLSLLQVARGASFCGPMLAMSLLSLVPMFIPFFVFQRKLIDGIATTGLKGGSVDRGPTTPHERKSELVEKPLIIVFTKPWMEPLPELAGKLAGLGFGGVELAVRPGYQVEPENVNADLPGAVRLLAEHGLKTASIASDPDEATIEACGAAGVGIIRLCAPIDMEAGYLASIDHHRRRFDAPLPVLERTGVAIGVQNHYGEHVGSALGLAHLLSGYDPKQVCAVLDMAHCAVDGEPVCIAVDIARPHLNGLVNFKSACHLRANGPEMEAEYVVHWTTHDHGGYNWRDLVGALHGVGFAGAFCIPAEYSQLAGRTGQRMGDEILPFLRKDIAHLKVLVAEIYT
ncbi:TIM barrel protein [Tropicimonas aquimaris]|uniref:TIM barrel protein n=1 Tax=Tropicimonas aquimaris TaxID=914152 RepID=A0ABW3IYX4_9RHOB